ARVVFAQRLPLGRRARAGSGALAGAFASEKQVRCGRKGHGCIGATRDAGARGTRRSRRLCGAARSDRAAAPRAARRYDEALPGRIPRQDAADRQRGAGRVGMSEGGAKAHVKLIAKNRRALFDYHVESRVEAGLALTGTEVKSLREGSAQLSDSYAIGQRGELFLLNAQIPPYKPAGPLSNHEPKRTRKLLLHRREIDRLLEQQQKGGYALIPLSIYFKDGRV